MKMDFIYTTTTDDLRLQGVLYDSESKNSIVLFIHGMSGNVIENYFTHVLGQTLANNGISFLYSHNRGYNHINDIATSELKNHGGHKTVRVGATFEQFTDCLLDIEAWINECRKLGYKRIILMGHSLGCNKTIYYFYKNKPEDVIGVILASPPDMVGLAKKQEYQPNFEKLYQEAQTNVSTGEPRKILSTLIWDWYNLSSQTFLSLFSENTEIDNLPLLRNPSAFQQLATIDVPMLGFMGEYDDIAIRTLKEDLDLIASKATSCPAFQKEFISKASHTYDGAEKQVAEIVLKWTRNLIGS